MATNPQLRASFTGALAVALIAVMATTPANALHRRRAATSGHHKAIAVSAHVTPHKLHGQQSIDSDRATAIQSALIREHYLSGAPTGSWDAESQSAMQKFQADQGWQTKLVPDSRALIKLGLGPDHSKAINATSASNFNVLSPGNTATQQNPGLTAASGVNN